MYFFAIGIYRNIDAIISERHRAVPPSSIFTSPEGNQIVRKNCFSKCTSGKYNVRRLGIVFCLYT